VAKNGSTSRYGAVVSLDESRLQAGLLYAGSDDGQISISEDDGNSWRKVNSFSGVPEYTYVYDLIADKHDVNVVYAAFNNHKSGDFKAYVYKSSDKGATWTNISGNLPEGAVYALCQDHVKKEILFAGTEYGVFVTLNGGLDWLRLKAGLPTINVRDMAIQERENDLVLATFGRGFYVLDNYAPLRELSESALSNDGYLFGVKDAYMYKTWRPLGGLGTKEKGFQGQDYFSVPNPALGAIFTYWIKDGVTTLKSERTKKDKEAFKKGEAIPYPTVDEYKAEQEEEAPYLIFMISDLEGNQVRELRTPLRKGMNKLTWDMTYPAGLSVTDRDANQSKGLPSSNVFVLPGDYKVHMLKYMNGEVSELAEAVSFKLKDLDNRTIPASDRSAMIKFKMKTLALDNALRAVGRAISEMNGKLTAYRAATKAFNTPVANKLLGEIDELEQLIKDVELALNGEATNRVLDIDGDYTLRSRARNAAFDNMRATTNITGTSKRNYEIAADEFAPILEKVKDLQDEFGRMDQQLTDMGAPLTPGRLPDWKK
jgi:hypothetical protein